MFPLLYSTWTSGRTCCKNRELLSVTWQPGWERLGKRDTWMCMAEALSHSPETTRKLLISYIPIQSKKFKV